MKLNEFIGFVNDIIITVRGKFLSVLVRRPSLLQVLLNHHLIFASPSFHIEMVIICVRCPITALLQYQEGTFHETIEHVLWLADFRRRLRVNGHALLLQTAFSVAIDVET